ncbi:uncharacterized protein CMU_032240 [Cryptosporidium muris RN66]|uniref:UAS domain-containing protein n=1 Tax=Cryptosporidium muris (strain RN66) TaxID=441375 RepID=B6AIP2_CRYMR|nr:uncharacterized protein CMU_032240 [Cryptosporidium muris RN66]EEA08083.1 hypothetical protein, conserved [Cryptosporidium muris RN66]|eukprot:XP_002142432.1 hypothetical protein [Cryptosporidium muris RN66]
MYSSDEVEQFLSVTGCKDRLIAQQYLDLYPNNINDAVNEYFSCAATEQENPNDTNYPVSSTLQEECEDIRTPIPSFNDQLIPDYMNQAQSNSHSYYMDQIALSEVISPRDDFSTQIFSPPESIISNEPFNTVKEIAKLEGKLILVNIQSPREFLSMILNRDIWNDSLVQEVITYNFIFWQRSSNTPEGSEWCSLYSVTHLPHVAVVEPRTGRQLKVWDVAKKFSDSLSASSEIIEFLECESTRKILNRLPSTNSSNNSNKDLESNNLVDNGLQSKEASIYKEKTKHDTNEVKSEVPISRINSELAMLHMERMRRKNMVKKD